MIDNIKIKEVKKVKLTSSAMLRFDTLSLDEVDLEIGKHGIYELVEKTMYEFKDIYGTELLIKILQDPDFKDITDILIVEEVAELDTKNRELKEELKEAESNYREAMNLLNSLQERN